MLFSAGASAAGREQRADAKRKKQEQVPVSERGVEDPSKTCNTDALTVEGSPLADHTEDANYSPKDLQFAHCDLDQAESEAVSLRNHNKDTDHNIASTSSVDADDAALSNAKHLSVVEEFFRCLNAHDLEGARALQTDDVIWLFRDHNGNLVHKMAWEDFRFEMTKCFDAFPDFTFTHKSLKSTKREGTVILLHVVTYGTHTGSPFAFGPCEAIEAGGKSFQNDPEDICFTFRDGRICKHEIFARGELTGPAGIYIQLGGFPLLGSLPPAPPA